MMVVASVACSAAGAEPAAPSAPAPALPANHPADWRPLPPIAAAVGAAAKADGVTIDAADAWGEPARGCYGVWLALHGGAAAAPALADQVLDSLRGDRTAEVTIDDLVAPTTPAGVLAFQFRRATYRGRVRAQLDAGRIAAIACFGNEREPARCDADCAAVLGGVTRPPSVQGASR
jgi:hypothetical protein